MADDERPANTQPVTTEHQGERITTEQQGETAFREGGLQGSAFISAHPANVASEAPAEIPAAAMSPSTPQASIADGASGGGEQGGSSEH